MTASAKSAQSLYAVVARSMVLILVCLIFLTLTSVYLYLSATSRHDYQIQAKERVAFLEANLDIPMWTFHTSEVRSLGRTLLMDDMVAAIIIRGADDKVWVSEQDPKREVDDMRSGMVFHQGQAIGSFELGLTHQPFREHVWKTLKYVALTALGFLALVVLLMRYLLQRHLRSPMQELLGKLDELGEGSYRPLRMEAPAEIEQILERFNQAAEKIALRETELRQSREQFSSLFDNVPFGIFRTRADGTILSVNPAGRQLLGFAPDQPSTPGARAGDVYADPGQREWFLTRLGLGPVRNFETRYQRADGSVFWASISARASFDEEGRVEVIDGGFVDVSEKHQTAEDLEALLGLSREILHHPTLKATLRALLRQALTVSDADRAGLFFCYNGEPSLEEHLEQIPAQAFEEAALLPYVQQVQNRGRALVFQAGDADRPELETLCREIEIQALALQPLFIDDQVIAVLALGFPDRRSVSGRERFFAALCAEAALGIHNARLFDELARRTMELEVSLVQVQDTEERNQQLQQQMLHAQKLQAVGTLAGGIAHDFNNILQALFGHTAVAKIRAKDTPEVLASLESIETAANRASQLVSQILAFSRQSKPQVQPVVVAEVVGEALHLLQAGMPASIQLEEHLASSDTILADPSQLHQIVMNLCTNARHAMPGGGTLRVTVEQFVADDDFIRKNLGMSAGDYVRLVVEDSGCGMPEEVQERIFEPFFTTRDQGEGTGLGLSVVHGIVKSLKGSIRIDSRPGEGTRFEIYLPSAGAAQRVDRQPARPLRILFVDDEPTQCELAETLLGNFGFQVEVFSAPEEALQSFRGDPGRFDLVLTDLSMPGLNGVDLARRLLEIRPELPIILCTGYSDRLAGYSNEELGFCDVIHKPIVGQQLARRIRQALELHQRQHG